MSETMTIYELIRYHETELKWHTQRAQAGGHLHKENTRQIHIHHSAIILLRSIETSGLTNTTTPVTIRHTK